ncbi:MAG TPA: hypothetical protein VND22_06660 [Actinomycetota bacterium]|nr:hypothetical protein [Actinomycetota bacterium]
MAAPRPKTLQTLPPDGTILEELIDGMKEEYGTPATPQEYRLQIRIMPEEAVPEPSSQPAANGDSGPRVRRSRRRGRRSRGKGRPDRIESAAKPNVESGSTDSGAEPNAEPDGANAEAE